MNCEHCGKDMTGMSASSHLGKCKVWLSFKKQNIESIVTYDFLYESYCVNKESVQHITSKIGLHNPRFIMSKLREFNIQVRTSKEAVKLDHKKSLAMNTSLAKYGSEWHTSKSSIIRQDIFDGVKKKYGVTNVFQSKEIKEKIKHTVNERFGVNYISQSKIIRDRVKNTCIERYGVDSISKVKEFIDRAQVTKAANIRPYVQASPISQRIFWALHERMDDMKEHNYFSDLNKEFGKYGNDRYYYFDFVNTEIRKCVEFNGDYYHMNPAKHQPEEYNKKRKMTAQQIWDYDKSKIDVISQCGYEVLVLWEADSFEDNVNKALNFITTIKQ